MVTYLEVEDDEDIEDVVSELLQADGTAGWRWIGDVCAFSKAIAAISVDELDKQEPTDHGGLY